VRFLVLGQVAGGFRLRVQGVLCGPGRYADLRRDMPAAFGEASHEVGIIIAFIDEGDEQ
jgi:hypothetical protein